MSLFGNYNTPGRGVLKAPQEKKGIFKFFEVYGRHMWKLMELNLLYFVFCIPLTLMVILMLMTSNPIWLLLAIPSVLVGPATAAMTKVCRNYSQERNAFLLHDFWDSFKKNFKQSVFIGIVDVIMIVSVWIACFQFLMNESLPDGSLVFICIMICCATLVFIMHFYIYLEIVALNLSIGSILKNAVFLVFLGVKRNFIALIINLAIISLIVLFLPFSVFAVIFLPLSLMCFTTTFICYPVIQKYIVNPYYEERGERNPELGPITEEDIAENAVFVDRGGSEKEIKATPKAHGKVIK